MAHPSGAASRDDLRLNFDRRVLLEFRGSQLSSDGGLMIVRELDDALGLSDLATAALAEHRTGTNRVHGMAELFRQAAYGRLAGYEDVNDAERLAHNPVMRQVVGDRAINGQAASTSQMSRFETEGLATEDNRGALADLGGLWVDRFLDRTGLKYIVLDQVRHDFLE